MLQSVIRNLVDSVDEEDRVSQRNKLEDDLSIASERLDALVQGVEGGGREGRGERGWERGKMVGGREERGEGGWEGGKEGRNEKRRKRERGKKLGR